VEGTAWASDALARMLVRHQRVREQGTPRITVLVGPPPLAAARWRHWLGATRRREADAPIWCAPDDADAAWLRRIARTALALVTRRAAQPAAIACPEPLVRLATAGEDRLAAALREGLVRLPGPAGRASSPAGRASSPAGRASSPAGRVQNPARSGAERILFEALERREHTRGLFRLNEPISIGFGGRAAEVDLLARGERLAIEIDGYHHFQSPAAYRRDRKKDALLQRHGLWVVRFLATDVVADPRPAVNEVVAMLAARRKGSR
jgi:very-short-patch-repair endonuclease